MVNRIAKPHQSDTFPIPGPRDRIPEWPTISRIKGTRASTSNANQPAPLEAEIDDVMMAGGSAAAGCSPDEFGKIPI